MSKMRKFNISRSRSVQTVNRIMSENIEDGLLWETIDNRADNTINFSELKCLNFGSCSYMGLHLHPALIAGTISAVKQYGTQVPYSRAYLSCDLYNELENLLGEITGRHALVGSSTTLVHLAALPVLISDDDAVIIDQFAHSSLYMGTELLESTIVVRLRHNDIDKLEQMIVELSINHKQIWYILDGLYSMRGDFAPFDRLSDLLNRYPNLHLYIDDAHSTSWYGTNGRGAAITHLPNNERIVVALSLNKAFSAAGGALIVSNLELKQKIRRCGSTMNFSGPIQAPMLGAAVASARLHLEPKFAEMQTDLKRKIEYTRALAERLGVKIIAQDPTPIFFIPFDSDAEARTATKIFWESGFYLCTVTFPAVPINYPGIRFTISSINEITDIDALIFKAEEIQRTMQNKRLEINTKQMSLK